MRRSRFEFGGVGRRRSWGPWGDGTEGKSAIDGLIIDSRAESCGPLSEKSRISSLQKQGSMTDPVWFRLCFCTNKQKVPRNCFGPGSVNSLRIYFV
jgi:hypothetical protein